MRGGAGFVGRGVNWCEEDVLVVAGMWCLAGWLVGLGNSVVTKGNPSASRVPPLKPPGGTWPRPALRNHLCIPKHSKNSPVPRVEL